MASVTHSTPQVDSVLEKIENGEGTLTVAELARITGYSVPAIYKAIDRGDIPVMRIGGIKAKRIDRKSLAYQLRKDNAAMRAASRG